MPLATVQEVLRYWANEYDWRKIETKLNSYPNFITEIDGLDIHFIHARSKHDNALPLIVTHGWPGSIIEQLKIIDPLVNPTAHGGSAADAFHVVHPVDAGLRILRQADHDRLGRRSCRACMGRVMKTPGLREIRGTRRRLGAIITDLMGVHAAPISAFTPTWPA